MRKPLFASALLLAALGLAPAAQAHFGMVIPERNLVAQADPKTVALSLLFWHPMENQGMDLARPAALGFVLEGKKTDLTPSLKEARNQERTVWQAELPIKRPGDYIVYLSPQPYFEPAEDKFIIHHTKTVVSALGAEEGWDAAAGLPLEIIPLTRPYGLYAGQTFTGRVTKRGKPLAGAVVEIEFYNQDGKLKAPADAYVAQVVKTDRDGVFSMALPWAGWWGFAALADDDKTMKKDGKDKKVELGGVLWVLAHAPLR